jgi:hypothetical protein
VLPICPCPKKIMMFLCTITFHPCKNQQAKVSIFCCNNGRWLSCLVFHLLAQVFWFQDVPVPHQRRRAGTEATWREGNSALLDTHIYNPLPSLVIPMSCFCIGIRPCSSLLGLHWKPYFTIGWLIYILADLILMISSGRTPSTLLYMLVVFVQTIGWMLADMATDALLVEWSRYESLEKCEALLFYGYLQRFLGAILGATMGALLYNKDMLSWYLPMRWLFVLNAAILLVLVVPFLPHLLELETNCRPKNVGTHYR